MCGGNPPEQTLTFDLITTTVGRTHELTRLLDSLEAQEHRSLRVLIVDQNDDDRLDSVLASARPFPILHLRSGRGISRGRNAALPHVTASVVAFPDDDCAYPPALLARVAAKLAPPGRDGVAGRLVDESGARTSGSWRADAYVLDRYSVWYGGVSATLFLRSDVVCAVGEFDVRLGLGSLSGELSGEESDYIVRALGLGARIEFDPALEIVHPARTEREQWSRTRGFRSGRSLGYILAKHGYPPGYVGRMLVRPAGGAIVGLARADLRAAAFQGASLYGRLRGLADGRHAARVETASRTAATKASTLGP